MAADARRGDFGGAPDDAEHWFTGVASEGLRSALSDAVASSAYPLGVSPCDFAAWYADWWPPGNDAKPGTSLMHEWFAGAEAEILDGRPQSEHTVVVLALIAQMNSTER